MRGQDGAGAMLCGAETFATHPGGPVAPYNSTGEMKRKVARSQAQAFKNGEPMPEFLVPPMHFALLAQVGDAGKPTFHGFDDYKSKGAQVLIERLEAGHIEVNQSDDEFVGNGTYTEGCLAMRPSRERMAR